MPDDIFNFHNGVIDQDPGYKTKRQQRHGVQREAHQVQKPESWNGRQWDSNRRYNRRTPIAQEQENHNDGKKCALNHRCHRAFILALGVIDAVEQRDEVNARIFFFYFRDFDHRIIKDGDIGRALCAGHAERDNLFAAGKGHGFLLAETVSHCSHIGQFD